MYKRGLWTYHCESRRLAEIKTLLERSKLAAPFLPAQ
jgi:hypothetical protein